MPNGFRSTTRCTSTDGEPQWVWRPVIVARRTAFMVTWRNTAPTSRAMVVAVMVSMGAVRDSTVINLALPATPGINFTAIAFG